MENPSLPWPRSTRAVGRPRKPKADRMEVYTVRLKPAHRKKLMQLGRDWLVTRIERA